MEKVRVPLFRPQFSQADVEAIAEVLYSGHITTGPRCEQFEQLFAERLGVAYAVSTNSATAALHLALAVADIGAGDIVFLPTLAFASDIQVIEWQGATPYLIDCEPRTLCMDPIRLQQTIQKLEKERSLGHSDTCPGKFRAVIALDYAGQMADYAALRSICEQYDMLLIEDASHALPAYWRENATSAWRSPGTVADMACYSFYANKPITTGEGGMVITNNEQWANQMKSMRLHGYEAEPGKFGPATWNRQVVRRGFKYNLSDLAAALGIRQLSQLDQFYQARREIAQEYTQYLSKCDLLQLPEELPNRQHAWHLYVVRSKSSHLAGKRDAIMQELYERGVETSIHWLPLHKHSYYQQHLHFTFDVDTMEAIYPSLMSLPLFPSMTEEELHFVITTLPDVLSKYSVARTSSGIKQQ